MKRNLLAIIVMLAMINLAWPQALVYEITHEFFDNAFTVDSMAQAINYNTGGSSSIQVCEGESYDLLSNIEYGTVQSSRMLSRCERFFGSATCDETKYNIVGANGVMGEIALLTNDDINEVMDETTITGYSGLDAAEKRVFDAVCSLDGGADLSLGDNHIRYADVDAGLGCSGEYRIYVNGALKKTGDLANIYSDSYAYAFNDDATVKYETSIQKCVGLMKEYYMNDDGSLGTVVHPFIVKTYGSMPKTASRSYNVEVVPDDRVDIQESGIIGTVVICDFNTGCAIYPDTFAEGTSSTVRLYLTLTNAGKVDVNIGQFNVESLSGDITIEGFSATPSSFALSQGESRTVVIVVQATAEEGASENNPHNIKVSYEYEAVDENICTNSRETGTNEYVFSVDASAGENEGTELQILSKMEPEYIDASNYEDVNSNGMHIEGTVSILPDNLIPWDDNAGTGATVTITQIEKWECNRDPPYICHLRDYCLDNPMQTESDNTGKFSIDANNLQCAIENDDYGFLRAVIDAAYKNLRGTNTTQSQINVHSPDLTCRIIIDEISINPTEETYNFKVTLENKDQSMEIPNEFLFDCGDGHGMRNGNDWAGDNPLFSCTYDITETFEVTKNAVFEMQYKKSGETKTVTCSTYANICGTYLG